MDLGKTEYFLFVGGGGGVGAVKTCVGSWDLPLERCHLVTARAETPPAHVVDSVRSHSDTWGLCFCLKALSFRVWRKGMRNVNVGVWCRRVHRES